MSTSAEIKKFPPISDWKNEERQAHYYKGTEKLSLVIYTIYKNSKRPPEVGPQEDIFCITFIQMNGEFALCSKKGNSRPIITGIGRDKEKAVQYILKAIFDETHVKVFCPKEKLEGLTVALKKFLESA